MSLYTAWASTSHGKSSVSRTTTFLDKPLWAYFYSDPVFKSLVQIFFKKGTKLV